VKRSRVAGPILPASRYSREFRRRNWLQNPLGVEMTQRVLEPVQNRVVAGAGSAALEKMRTRRWVWALPF